MGFTVIHSPAECCSAQLIIPAHPHRRGEVGTPSLLLLPRRFPSVRQQSARSAERHATPRRPCVCHRGQLHTFTGFHRQQRRINAANEVSADRTGVFTLIDVCVEADLWHLCLEVSCFSGADQADSDTNRPIHIVITLYSQYVGVLCSVSVKFRFNATESWGFK